MTHVLYDQTLEPAAHMFCHFPFTAEVQFKLHCRLHPNQDAATSYNNIQVPTVQDWWARHTSAHKQDAQQAMYLAWNIWNVSLTMLLEPLTMLPP